MSYYQRRSSGLWTLVFLIIALVAFIIVARNPQFRTWLSQFGKTLGPQFQQPPQQPQQPQQPPTTPPPSPPSTTDGTISSDTTCPSGGETCQEDNQGRYDCDSVTADSYEATWCGSFSGDDLTIKLYGPPHSEEGDCCWCVLHITPGNGQFKSGGEGPHSGSNCDDKGDGESIGTTDNICVKAVMKPGPTMIGYALVNGQWKEMSSYTGPCGCSETKDEKSGDQVTFRCDGNFNTTCATVKPLGAGGITPAPSTPSPTEDDEEDEEDEPPPTPTPTPPATPTTCPANCEPFRNSPGTYQNCCRTASGGAVRARSARSYMYDKLHYKYEDARFLNPTSHFMITANYSRIRVGNLI